ncbi:hypothetical protein ABIF69_004530 [Bradyrhizobium japonicum]
MSEVAAPAFPADEWRELLQALWPTILPTSGPSRTPNQWRSSDRRGFPGSPGFAWRPVGETFGIAILELADPGTFAPNTWAPVCGPLVRCPITLGAGPILQGLVELPETGNRAAVYLTTDRSSDDPQARVTEVRTRIEPV